MIRLQGIHLTEFSKRIRFHRSMQRVSRHKLAKLTGISVYDLTLYESGERQIPKEHVLAIGKALNLGDEIFAFLKGKYSLPNLYKFPDRIEEWIGFKVDLEAVEWAKESLAVIYRNLSKRRKKAIIRRQLGR